MLGHLNLRVAFGQKLEPRGPGSVPGTPPGVVLGKHGAVEGMNPAALLTHDSQSLH